jgi:hypothetical protein
MQLFGIITALFFASAVAACDNGPYDQGKSCGGTCVDALRCGNNNYVVSSHIMS